MKKFRRLISDLRTKPNGRCQNTVVCEQKPGVGGSSIACYETKDKGHTEGGLFPLVFCFYGLFSWVCFFASKAILSIMVCT